MRAIVVYESMFGNTRTVAEAVAIGLSLRGMDVEASEVGTTPTGLHEEIDLLVVGAPTHTFTLSRPVTRTSASEQATDSLVSEGIGLREWLEELPAGRSMAVAAFDTHVDKRLPGSASRSAQRRLRRRGYRTLLPPESFHVADLRGPLVDGEVERARGWGARLASAVGAPGAHPTSV